MPALVVVAASVFVSVINASMTTVALPDVQADFGVADDELAWFITAFLVTMASGTVMYGRMVDMHGARRMFLLGMVLFALTSFATAAAPTYWTAVAARTFQGLGSTAVPSVGMAAVVRTTTGVERGRFLGVIILAVGIGFGAGPLVGGTLTEWAGWRAPFVATGTGAVILVPAALLTMPRVPGFPGQRFDWAGAALLTGAVTGMLLALNRLPRDITDPAGLAGIGAALPLVGGLALRISTASQPFISPGLLRRARFVALCFVGLCIQAVHFGVVVQIPLLLERYAGLSIINIGFHLLPGALALGLFGITGGWLAARVGVRPLLIGGTWLLFAGTATFHLAGTGWEPAGVAGLYVVVAAGFGMANAAALNAATSELPDELAGTGIGIFNLLFFLGGATSVATAGAILRVRETALEALDPLVRSGRAPEFSDALIPVLAFAFVAFLIAVAVKPRAHQGALTAPAAPGLGLTGRLKANRPARKGVAARRVAARGDGRAQSGILVAGSSHQGAGPGPNGPSQREVAGGRQDGLAPE
ncbi:MAG: MDR family MFS transporter [Dehalococcoidia bacterium]